MSFFPSIHPSSHSVSPSLLCVNSKSFSKSLFSFYTAISPGYKKWIIGALLLQEVCLLNSFSPQIHSLCEFNLHATALLSIYHIYCVFVFICDQFICSLQTDPPSHWWKILTKIDRAICETIEVQYTLRLSFALRNFNCFKINRGWCWILNLLLVYELLARRHLTHIQVHETTHTLRVVIIPLQQHLNISEQSTNN